MNKLYGVAVILVLAGSSLADSENTTPFAVITSIGLLLGMLAIYIDKGGNKHK